jgi:hypothetical protein
MIKRYLLSMGLLLGTDDNEGLGWSEPSVERPQFKPMERPERALISWELLPSRPFRRVVPPIIVSHWPCLVNPSRRPGLVRQSMLRNIAQSLLFTTAV